MKLALINPPYMMEKVSKIGMPSIGQGYISSFLEKNGLKNDLFDFSYALADNSEIIDANKLLEYDILGIASYTISFLKTIEFIREIKKRKKDIIIMVGGHHASLAPEIILNDFDEVDYVVIGYGELGVYELIQTLCRKGKIEDVRGIAYREKGKIHVNQQCYQYSLDDLPFPKRMVINEVGLERDTLINGTLTISSSRGCPYTCFYCVNSIRRGWQCRTPENVLEELREVSYTQKFREIYFVDCNFFVDVKRAVRLLELIHYEFPWVTFNIQMRCDQVEKNEWAIAKLSNINCRTINIGVESNSQKVINRFNKLTTPEMNQKAIDILKKYNINPVTYFIMFEALMDMEDIECNINFIEKNNLVTIYNMDNIFNTMMPFVGTPYYEKYSDYYEGDIHSIMRPVFQDKKVKNVYNIVKEFRDEFEDDLIVYLEKLLNLSRLKSETGRQSQFFSNVLVKLNFTILKIVYKEVKENQEKIFYEDIVNKYGLRKLIKRIECFIDSNKAE